MSNKNRSRKQESSRTNITPASKKRGNMHEANPADFGKKTSPVRERLARDLAETPPEERIKRGH